MTDGNWTGEWVYRLNLPEVAVRVENANGVETGEVFGAMVVEREHSGGKWCWDIGWKNTWSLIAP